mmetsp:Transcript_13022/g.28049  ORF Transcript_13022/g.28049 Transcript_13022/m.28049 type:complete len:100 (+) Transcript_13022:225-524(+)
MLSLVHSSKEASQGTTQYTMELYAKEHMGYQIINYWCSFNGWNGGRGSHHLPSSSMLGEEQRDSATSWSTSQQDVFGWSGCMDFIVVCLLRQRFGGGLF